MRALGRLPFAVTGHAIGLASAIAWLAGCGASHSEEASVSVDLGTGESSFQSIEDGQTLSLVAGSQGGFHVWISFRGYGFEDTRLNATIATQLVALPDTEARSELTLKLERGDDGAVQWFGWPGVIDTSVCPLQRELTLFVELGDEVGRRGADERRIRVVHDGTSRFPTSCSESM